MKDTGIKSFWYYDVGAFALVGDRTTLSISGKKYRPTDTKVKRDDLVTVDLSPQLNGCWGDFARSFVIGDGKVVTSPTKKTRNLFKGISTEEALHLKLREVVTPDMTFEELQSRTTGQ